MNTASSLAYCSKLLAVFLLASSCSNATGADVEKEDSKLVTYEAWSAGPAHALFAEIQRGLKNGDSVTGCPWPVEMPEERSDALLCVVPGDASSSSSVLRIAAHLESCGYRSDFTLSIGTYPSVLLRSGDGWVHISHDGQTSEPLVGLAPDTVEEANQAIYEAAEPAIVRIEFSELPDPSISTSCQS